MTPLPSPSVSPKGTARHAPIPTAGRYGKEVYSSSGVVSPAGGGAAGGHGRDAGGAAGSALAIPQCPPLGTAGMPAPSLQSSAPAASLPEPPRLCFPRSAAGPCREMRGCAGRCGSVQGRCRPPLPVLTLHTPLLTPSGQGSPPLQQAQYNIELRCSSLKSSFPRK